MAFSRSMSLARSGVRAARVACAVALIAAAQGGVALAGGPGGWGGGAPEIDAGSAMSALTLLTGGILLITDRIRRRGPGR